MSWFVVDLSFLDTLASATPWQAFWFVFSHGGWLLMLYGLLWGLWEYWKFYIFNNYADSIKRIVLAIDVPKNNEQGPLAVENIFSHIAGIHGTETLWEEYWKGEHQQSLSFEIVSIGGYVQFVVQCPAAWRDVVESAVYAQYPDAEITEIEDYVPSVPQHWPNPDYKFFGIEYKLNKPDCYPIRTWPEFEDKLEGVFKDPMAATLEAMSNLIPGEQAWIQYVITPITDDWRKKGEKEVNKLIARAEEHHESILAKILGIPFTIMEMVIGFVHHILFGPAEGSVHAKAEKEYPTMMMHMTPGEKDKVAAIEHKISKIGFRTKCRVMYIARKEVYNSARGTKSLMGALKQFNSSELNRLAVQKKIWTKVYYVFTKYRLARRQNHLMKAYRVRSDARGAGPGSVLNIEELASLWHFPVMQVKAPLVKRTEAKRAEPPFALPISRSRAFQAPAPAAPIPKEQLPENVPEQEEDDKEFEALADDAPPDNLPVV